MQVLFRPDNTFCGLFCQSEIIYVFTNMFSLISYLPSNYITVTQFQYILTISIAGNLRQTK